MMKKTAIIVLMALSFAGCKKSQAPQNPTITDFTVTSVSQPATLPDTVIIDEDNKTISLMFSNSLSTMTFPLSVTATFNLAEGATSEPASGSTLTFNTAGDLSDYIVTASDGVAVTYTVSLRDKQIPDSDFETWYLALGLNSVSFYEPGIAANNTYWATANMGTSSFGVYCTTPLTADGNTAVKIVTGQTSLVPITAGTLFNGYFDVNGALSHPTDPKQATTFGIPFSFRPYSFSFSYTYQPGSQYIQATLKNPNNIFGGFTVSDISGTDSFTAYAVLERRTPSGIIEIGKATLTSSAVQGVMTTAIVPFTYTSTERPTHIYIVFSSSKDGDLWKGAVGSELVVDNLELRYAPEPPK